LAEPGILVFGTTGSPGRHILDELVSRGTAAGSVTAAAGDAVVAAASRKDLAEAMSVVLERDVVYRPVTPGKLREVLTETGMDDELARFLAGLDETIARRDVLESRRRSAPAPGPADDRSRRGADGTVRGGGERRISDGTAPSPGKRFWINTVSLDHVEEAAAGGFTQADHGAGTRLRRPRPGDEMIFYSPRTHLRGGEPVRQFTAWATITGDKPYQAHVSDDFHPWRLAAAFHACERTEAKPLVGRLSFIADPQHWGLPFRRGLFQVPQQDFEIIKTRMTAGEG
jgi:hypothetical protein